MKTTKLFYAPLFALVVALAATGCHTHKPVGVTPLPNEPGMVGQEQNQTTLPPGTQLNPQPEVQPGGGPLPATPLEYLNMIEDTNTLAVDTIHFAFDSSVIRKSEKSNLQAVASVLASDHNLKLLIQGNCDERGTEEYNRALGERRALAAREALAKLGIDPMSVYTISYGEDRPVDPSHDEAAWAKNRRDDFVLLHPKM